MKIEVARHQSHGIATEVAVVVGIHEASGRHFGAERDGREFGSLWRDQPPIHGFECVILVLAHLSLRPAGLSRAAIDASPDGCKVPFGRVAPIIPARIVGAAPMAPFMSLTR